MKVWPPQTHNHGKGYTCNNGKDGYSRFDDDIKMDYKYILSITYHDIRRQYLPTYFRVRPSMFKCIELLNTNKDKTVRSLAKYVFEAFRVRSLSVSWYVHVLCVMHWRRRGAVAVATAGRWSHPWMSVRHSRLQTVIACGRRDRLPLPQCLVSTQYFVLYATMSGYYNLFCHVCEYHEVGIVKWTLVRACGLRSG